MSTFEVIVNFKKILIEGAGVTIILGVVMLLGGAILGSIYAAILSMDNSLKGVKVLKKVVHFLVEIFRGAPLITLLFFGYYGLAYLGVRLDEMTSCMFVLILYAGAYICEIVRSGLEAISKGQWEAGYCLGLSYLEVMRFIIFPQAFNIFLPSLIGFFIAAVKDTSIVSLIGCEDIFAMAKTVINRTNMPLQIYTVVAIFFFVFCFPMSRFVKRLERKNATAR